VRRDTTGPQFTVGPSGAWDRPERRRCWQSGDLL